MVGLDDAALLIAWAEPRLASRLARSCRFCLSLFDEKSEGDSIGSQDIPPRVRNAVLERRGGTALWALIAASQIRFTGVVSAVMARLC